MSEEIRKCPYCWHDYHGAVEPLAVGFASSFAPVSREGKCAVRIDDGKRACNCDGRVQWFSYYADSYEAAEEWTHRAAEAGYTVYPFNKGAIAVHPVGANGDRISERWVACVFSDTLPPVASREEFNQRIGL